MVSPSTIRDVISSLNSGDSDKVAACFAPDAKIVTHSSRSRRGKASGDAKIRLAAEPSPCTRSPVAFSIPRSQ